ncbi:MAG: bifunctional diaminohydroxyphosphoribosylaminopyrimidine deaminase/5-amino-6-(5-phosphoribosylamino)uracil reductase RibD [Acidimicrobiia bacterium]|nr:bifunctional diaminohydroxyphosphoribosylaminopyrimidine deaminase/5-amino-6-(5-phosphoribosylamino)uracil reductase RibD [Acidimicrobiia bacterium]
MALVTDDERPDDASLMAQAVARAANSRLVAPPNPWVGAVLVTPTGVTFEGSTRRPGSAHAEREALRRAGDRAAGGTLYVTLEPCCHHGRTPPCVDAVIEADVARVVVAVSDPDRRVGGSGIERLQAAGIEVAVGPGAGAVEEQLAPYLKHRRTGRPLVVVKLATTLDGRTAAADGTSQWITGEEARLDAHRLRAESDAVLVGAGTVRADDPRLTVRGVIAGDGAEPRQPLRVVLGRADPSAAIQPCVELGGDLTAVLDELGRRDVAQVLVEGGATVAGAFHRAGLVDRYVIYLAPALMGGDDGTPLLSGPGASSIGDLRRLQLDRVVKLGHDLRIDLTLGTGAGLA